jgi:hypothetical protein
MEYHIASDIFDAHPSYRRWAQTRDIFFNVDGLPPTDDDQIRAAMRDVEDLVVEHTGGHIVAAAVLTANNPSFHVQPWR